MICDKCHTKNDPEDEDVLIEHKLDHVYMRSKGNLLHKSYIVLDFQRVEMESVQS